MTDKAITNFYTQMPAHGGAPKQLVVLLHGVGSNGRDLISLAPFWARYVPDAVFVSPDAPFVCDMVPPGYPDAYQWFSLQSRDPVDMLAGVEVVQPLVDAFLLEQMAQYGLSADKVVLAGFSQGTMTSLYVGPRFESRLAGVLGYSGALIGEQGLKALEDAQKPPVCLIHGESDDVVPLAAYEHARGALIGAGFEVSGHSTPGLPHSIDEAGIEAGGAFLKRVLS